jgi:uncharacterized membrane protein
MWCGNLTAEMKIDRVPARGTNLHHLFNLVVALKGFFGLIELAVGAALATVQHVLIVDWANWLTHGELIEDPHDVIASLVLHWAEGFGHDTQLFAGLYLMAHGVVKAILVTGLLLDKRWAFPLSILLFSLLVLISVLRLSLHWSWFLCGFAVFDIFAIWMIAKEWISLRTSPTST